MRTFRVLFRNGTFTEIGAFGWSAALDEALQLAIEDSTSLLQIEEIG